MTVPKIDWKPLGKNWQDQESWAFTVRLEKYEWDFVGVLWATIEGRYYGSVHILQSRKTPVVLDRDARKIHLQKKGVCQLVCFKDGIAEDRMKARLERELIDYYPG